MNTHGGIWFDSFLERRRVIGVTRSVLLIMEVRQKPALISKVITPPNEYHPSTKGTGMQTRMEATASLLHSGPNESAYPIPTTVLRDPAIGATAAPSISTVSSLTLPAFVLRGHVCHFSSCCGAPSTDIQ